MWVSSTKLDARLYQQRPTSTDEKNQSGDYKHSDERMTHSGWQNAFKERIVGAKGNTAETGTYKTSVEFAGIRPGKPLKNRIDPCQ